MISEWIDKQAACQGEAVYLQETRGERTLTYAGLRAGAAAWSRRLDEAGLPPGTPVAVRLADPLEYATALVALIGAGRVVVPLDPGAPAADLARVLDVARPAAAVADDPFGIDMPILRPEPAGDDQPGDQLVPGTEGYSGGIYLCTSGTTGTPKGILLSEAQLAHVASSVVRCHGLGGDDRGYCPLPLFHVNAEVVGLLSTLCAGAYLAIDRKFSRRGFWEMIARLRISWINAVPAIISILAMDDPRDAVSAMGSGGGVRFVRSASAPLPRAALERFEEAFGIPIVETYGMTEAASMITANPVDGVRKPGSSGKPAGTEVRVVTVSETGTITECGPSEVGRVQIRGAGVITAYASGGRPGVISPDGWLDTSDLGYLDADGYLFLAGRSDDVINRGGEKIYPREIEEHLIAQPGVRSAVVVGAPDDVLGEVPVAWILPASGEFPAEDLKASLHAACVAGLPRHKQPKEYFVVDEMPLGATGKIARRQLKDLAATREVPGAVRS
ncbi:MAG: AMP-binding protein [Nocardiopsaceae bacterium]|nr:AMP-binding protein [Nocardiopsaceae bacterium]